MKQHHIIVHKPTYTKLAKLLSEGAKVTSMTNIKGDEWRVSYKEREKVI